MLHGSAVQGFGSLRTRAYGFRDVRCRSRVEVHGEGLQSEKGSRGWGFQTRVWGFRCGTRAHGSGFRDVVLWLKFETVDFRRQSGSFPRLWFPKLRCSFGAELGSPYFEDAKTGTLTARSF